MLTKLFVTFFGGLLVNLIFWFFFARKESAVAAGNNIVITVDGGYSPSTIQIKKNQKVTLHFFRKDPSSCLEEVVLPDFGKKVFLPLNQTIDIELQPEKTGEYEISCGMNMFHGKLIVKE